MGVHSAIIFIFSKLFGKDKLSAIGISNLPTAIEAFQGSGKKEGGDKKEDILIYATAAFQVSAVAAGILGRWPAVIQWNAIFNIITSVKESIDTRKKEEAAAVQRALERQDSKDKSANLGKRASLSRFVKNLLFSSKAEEEEEEKVTEQEEESKHTETDASGKPKKSKSEKAQKKVKKVRKVLQGKRDSATDDMIWGVFQVSFVFLNQTSVQALYYAWLMFLLTVLEEAVFNPKLQKVDRVKKCAWIVGTGYLSGRLVLKK